MEPWKEFFNLEVGDLAKPQHHHVYAFLWRFARAALPASARGSVVVGSALRQGHPGSVVRPRHPARRGLWALCSPGWGGGHHVVAHCTADPRALARGDLPAAGMQGDRQTGRQGAPTPGCTAVTAPGPLSPAHAAASNAWQNQQNPSVNKTPASSVTSPYF